MSENTNKKQGHSSVEFKRPNRQQHLPVRRTQRQPNDAHTVTRPGVPHPPQPAPVAEASRPSENDPKKQQSKTIAINIKFDGVPKLPKKADIVTKVRKFFVTKRVIAASIVTVVAVGSLTANAIIQQQQATNQATAETGDLIENIEYQTVLPSGKTISDLGGWKRISPPEAQAVYAYGDSIDRVPISVSQQPLPESSKGSTDEHVAEIAKKFNATSKIDAGNTKVYVGTSAKGPQSAILSKNGLLILIKSQNKIADKSWSKYASSLE